MRLMGKRFSWLIFGLVSLGLVTAGIVSADAPIVSITSPTGALNFSSLPQTVNVEGTITHDPNVSPVNELTLSVNGTQVGDSVDPGWGGGIPPATTGFSLPWTITAPGSYTLEVKARHGNDWGSDTEAVVVTVVSVVVDCPAAPSIAAHLLRDAGFKMNESPAKNYVAQVADHMGPQTDFDGAGKCSAGYAGAVYNYLQGIGALD